MDSRGNGRTGAFAPVNILQRMHCTRLVGYLNLVGVFINKKRFVKICENLSLCMLKRGAYLTFLGRGSMNSPMKIIGTRYVGYLSFEGVIRNKKIAKTWKFGTLYAKKRCILYFSEERCINSPQMKIMDTRPVQLLLPPIWTVCLLLPNDALLSWYWLKLP